MALQKQITNLALTGGVDTKTDPKQIIATKLTSLQNGIFIDPKEIRKRYGYTSIGQGGLALGSGNFIQGFNDEIALNNGQKLYSYAVNQDLPIEKGIAVSCEITTQSIIRSLYNQTNADSASINGFTVFAWQDTKTTTGGNPNNYVAAIDDSTGQIIATAQISVSSSDSYPRCVAITDSLGHKYVAIYTYSTTHTDIYVAHFDGTQFGEDGNLGVPINSTYPNFDVITIGVNVYVAFNSTTGGGGLECWELDGIGLSALHTAVLSSYSSDNAILTIATDSHSNLYYAFGLVKGSSVTAGKLKFGGYTTTLSARLPHLSEQLLTTTGVVNLKSITMSTTSSSLSTSVSFFYDNLGTAIGGYYIQSQIYYATLGYVYSSGVSGLLFGAPLCPGPLASKAFVRDAVAGTNAGTPSVIAIYPSQLQSTYFVVDYAGNAIGKIAYGLAGAIPANGFLAAVNSPSSNVFQVALSQKDLAYSGSSGSGVAVFSQNGVISATLDYTFTNPASISAGNNLLFGGGFLQMYDGLNVFEYNFHTFPEGISAATASSGGNLGTGTFGYQVVFEYVDNQGNIYQSTPSIVVSAVYGSGSTNQTTLTIFCVPYSTKPYYNVVIYRTAANGTIYYRLNSYTAPQIRVISTDHDNGTFSFTYADGASDASIAANQQLYTTGGVLPNIPVSATTIMAKYKTRILAVPSENPFSFLYSQETLPNTPVTFAQGLEQNFTTVGGGLKALAEMDSNLIIFKRSNILVMNGEGPTASGSNNDFSLPQDIATDVGCISAPSVVLTPMGLMFQSEKGIYLLDRSLAPIYIGADVEAYNSYTVTSAVLMDKVNQVRFTLSNGTALVYDYFMKQWSVFSNISAVSSAVINGSYYFLKSDGTILQESTGFTDNGSFIQLSGTTAWVALAGIQGFQRIYKVMLLGTYRGVHTLGVTLAYDYASSAQQSVTITPSSSVLYQFAIGTSQQKCEAIQIAFSDSQSSAYNEGYSLSNIAFELGLKQGLKRLPAAVSYG